MNSQPSISRRVLLGGAAAAVATTACPSPAASAVEVDRTNVPDNFTIQNKKIRQSVMGWCFKPMPVPELIRHCADIGLEAIEGISPQFYPEARKQGLKISLVSSHGFARGPVDPANHDECVTKLKASIDKAVEFGAPSVITFTGMSVPGINDQAAEKNCLDCWKKVIGYAEEKQITLVLEHLNS